MKLEAESLAAFDRFSEDLLKDERCERRWGTLLIARRNLGLPLIHDVAFRCSKSGFRETSIPAFRVLLKDLKFESTLCSDWVTFLEQHEDDDLEGTVRILEYLNSDESQAFLSELMKRSHRFRSVYETMKKESNE